MPDAEVNSAKKAHIRTAVNPISVAALRAKTNSSNNAIYRNMTKLGSVIKPVFHQ